MTHLRGIKAGTVVLCSAVFVVPLLQGCSSLVASGSPDVDARFGDSARQLRAQQLIDADSPQRNAQMRQGTDARTAREARDRYLQTYTEPPPPVTTILVAPTGSR
jgi:hypothetical protein